MKRAIIIRAFVLLLASVVIAPSASGQGREDHGSKRAGARAGGRLYTPRVLGYSATSILEGRIVSIDAGRAVIKTEDGARHRLLIDEATSIFESGEMVSIATMADITLKPSDLKPSDFVEIIVERASPGRVSPGNFARIITRIARGQVAKR